MIELIQFPWSPFCIVQRRLLEFSGAAFKITNIPSTDRSLVWKLTRERYYAVPIIRDGRDVVFEVSEESQVIAKYLDAKLQLGLFPWGLEGAQSILWRHIEGRVEGPCFKLNDLFYEEFVPAAERLNFLRHKERRFGRGCIEEWRRRRSALLAELAEELLPFEEMLIDKPYLLEERPRFIDFDLFGMLGAFHYSGRYRLPARHNRLRRWYRRMTAVQLTALAPEEELHTRH